MRKSLFLCLLIVWPHFACTSPGTLPTGKDPLKTEKTPPGTLFSEEMPPQAAAERIRRLQKRLQTAQKWDRPLWTPTVFSRARLPLPKACQGWGHVAVLVPDAETVSGIPGLFFMLEPLPMVRLEAGREPVGPEGEPTKKSTQGSPITVCAVFLRPSPARPDRASVAVSWLWTGENMRFIQAFPMKTGFLLHAAAGKTPLRASWPPLVWKNGDIFVWLGPTGLRPLSWAEKPVPWVNAARLQVQLPKELPDDVLQLAQQEEEEDTGGVSSGRRLCLRVDAQGRLHVPDPAKTRLHAGYKAVCEESAPDEPSH